MNKVPAIMKVTHTLRSDEPFVFANIKTGKSCLTQAEVQFLLSYLQRMVKAENSYKVYCAGRAAGYWSEAEKGTVEGEKAFREFSYNHAEQVATKTKIKKLSSVVRKLKSMR